MVWLWVYSFFATLCGLNRNISRGKGWSLEIKVYKKVLDMWLAWLLNIWCGQSSGRFNATDIAVIYDKFHVFKPVACSGAEKRNLNLWYSYVQSARKGGRGTGG